MQTRSASYALVHILTLLLTALATAQNLRTSTTGSCAGNTGLTCLNSRWGNCCSPNGFCGTNETYCGAGCQTGFGACYPNANRISTDGSCGASANSTICLGSIFGNCCSANGFCGRSDGHCGDGCQSNFGACGIENASNVSLATVVVSAGFTSTVASSSLSTLPTGTTTSTSTGSSSATTATTTASTEPSSTSQTLIQSQPVTSTASFKAGMAVMAVVIAIILAALIWFFAIRKPAKRKQQQQHHSKVKDKNGAPISYHEKDGTLAAQSKSELGGFPVSELPADYARPGARGDHTSKVPVFDSESLQGTTERSSGTGV